MGNSIVVGLGYGDEGKGATTDYLCKYHGAVAAVRYNGGPQSGHHVVREDGSWHCFTQFGSGTLTPGILTHHSSRMLVKPYTMFDEEAKLQALGITDAFDRLTIDPSCHMVMPYHAMMGQVREAMRNEKRYGTTGKGVGEAIEEGRAKGDAALTMKDLGNAAGFREKVLGLWSEYCSETEKLFGDDLNGAAGMVYRAFVDYTNIEEMVARPLRLVDEHPNCLMTDDEFFARQPDSLVMEGAQGSMLHEYYGFVPHITKSAPLVETAMKLLRDNNALSQPPTVIGILRAYSTRHGHGPFATEHHGLTERLPEPYHDENIWNGRFRSGWLDLVMTRYAIELNGRVDYISLSCLDRLAGLPEIKVCISYEYTGSARDELSEFFDWYDDKGAAFIYRIKEPYALSRERILRRTELMRDCVPLHCKRFESWETPGRNEPLPASMKSYINFISRYSGAPVGIISLGPTAEDRRFL